jgi:hypothetical protein
MLQAWAAHAPKVPKFAGATTGWGTAIGGGGVPREGPGALAQPLEVWHHHPRLQCEERAFHLALFPTWRSGRPSNCESFYGF